MVKPQSAVHRTILVVDVEGFGNQRRTDPHRLMVRDGMYGALKRAFAKVNIWWDGCHREDRGDGVLVLAPPEVPKAVFAESLPHELVKALAEHNGTHCEQEQIRLRMALHAGEVSYDEHGVTAASVNLAFRLLDARSSRPLSPNRPACWRSLHRRGSSTRLSGTPQPVTQRHTAASRSRSRKPPPWAGLLCRITLTRPVRKRWTHRQPGTHARTASAACSHLNLRGPGGRAGEPDQHPRQGSGRPGGQRHRDHLGDQRHGRHRQDCAGPALGARGRPQIS